MYTERKISMQYPQPFSGLSCLTGTNNLVSKNNFIKNLERARGEGVLKKYDSTLKFFSLCCYFRLGGWVNTLTVKNCYFLRVYILARLLKAPLH